MIALKKAFDAEGTSLRAGHCLTIHHSDQGGQYAAKAYVSLLESKGVLVSMASIGCPEENGYAERWMRTLKEDHVQMSEYSDFWEVLLSGGGDTLVACPPPVPVAKIALPLRSENATIS